MTGRGGDEDGLLVEGLRGKGEELPVDRND